MRTEASSSTAEPSRSTTVDALVATLARTLSRPEFLSEGPLWEARELVAFALGIAPAQLAGRAGQAATAAQHASLEAVMKRRADNAPTGYIVGAVDIGGVRFTVDRRGFIPRQDLVVLVEAGLLGAPAELQGFALDLACGIGAAGICLALARPGLHVDLADVSPEAIELARENAERLVPGRARAIASDLFAALPGDRRGQYEVITANPPWVPDGTALPEEVIKHEPHVSFWGGPDGLDVVRRLVAELPSWLKPGGTYAQECDPTQVAKVLLLLEEAGLREGRAHRDAEGVERVVSARLLR